MRRFGKGAVIVAVALSLAMFAGGCKKSTKASNAVKGQKGGTLVDYYTFAAGEPSHIDPGLASELSGAQVALLAFDGLTATDNNGKTIPWLASSWDLSSDGLTYTFHLHKSNFSNGDPVLPSSFKYAWERVLQSSFGSEISYHLEVIKGATDVEKGTTKALAGVTADDAAMTLKVELNSIYGIFPTTLSHNVFSPVDAPVVSKIADQTQVEQSAMVGNGPFIEKTWNHNNEIDLDPNPKYWGGPTGSIKPFVNHLILKISKDIDTAYAAFQAKQGATAAVPPGKYAEAAATYKNTSDLKPSAGIYYFGFNQSDPIVGGDKNLKLRQAIAHVIDKSQINRDAYSGSRKVATGVTPPGIPGFKENLDPIASAAPDLTVAKALLAEWEAATGKKATSITLKLNFNAGADHQKVAADIADNLKSLGIKSTQDPRASDVYFSQMRQGQGQFLRAGWIADYLAYDNMLYPLFFSTNAGTGDNLVQYKNTTFDGLINQARAAKTETAAEGFYQQAEAQVLKDVAIVPIVWYTNNVVWDTSLQNVHVSPLQFVNYDQIWIKK